jgi:phage portal protein BeeE
MSIRTYWTDFRRSLGASLASSGTEYSMFSSAESGWGKETSPADYLKSSLGVSVAVRYRSTKLASVPIRFHKVAASGKKTQVTSGELFDLFQKVNPYWTARRLLEMSEISLCLWGETVWFLDRGGARGAPKEIWWAHPDQVKVIPSSTDYISHFEFTPKNGGKPIRFERSETFWARYPNPDNEYEGLAPLWAAMLSADIGTAAMRSNARMFSQGMQLAGFVSPPKGDTWSKEQGARN